MKQFTRIYKKEREKNNNSNYNKNSMVNKFVRILSIDEIININNLSMHHRVRVFKLVKNCWNCQDFLEGH